MRQMGILLVQIPFPTFQSESESEDIARGPLIPLTRTEMDMVFALVDALGVGDALWEELWICLFVWSWYPRFAREINQQMGRTLQKTDPYGTWLSG